MSNNLQIPAISDTEFVIGASMLACFTLAASAVALFCFWTRRRRGKVQSLQTFLQSTQRFVAMSQRLQVQLIFWGVAVLMAYATWVYVDEGFTKVGWTPSGISLHFRWRDSEIVRWDEIAVINILRGRYGQPRHIEIVSTSGASFESATAEGQESTAKLRYIYDWLNQEWRSQQRR